MQIGGFRNGCEKNDCSHYQEGICRLGRNISTDDQKIPADLIPQLRQERRLFNFFGSGVRVWRHQISPLLGRQRLEIFPEFSEQVPPVPVRVVLVSHPPRGEELSFFDQKRCVFAEHFLRTQTTRTDVHHPIRRIFSLGYHGISFAGEIFDHLIRGALIHHPPPAPEQHDVVEQVEDKFPRLVDDAGDRHSALHQIAERVHDETRRGRVQSRGRLVQKQHFGLRHELQPDVHAFLFATRDAPPDHVADQVVADPAQPQISDDFVRELVDVLLRGAGREPKPSCI
mmetsp:Transcript_18912/g.37628  ORF Transcript_18912/g.37628 Transcript_18912/m.37628 type:complete len:284 (-) Transcript_18912:1985-2836(-)